MRALVRLLQILGGIPGLGMFEGMANNIISKQSQLQAAKNTVDRRAEDVRQARDAAGEMMGGGMGGDDDRTVLRP